jgi:hypothetical protein
MATAAVFDMNIEKIALSTIIEKTISLVFAGMIERIVTDKKVSNFTRFIASAIRNPAKNKIIIGLKNNDNDPVAVSILKITMATGMRRALADNGMISVIHKIETVNNNPRVTSEYLMI